MLYDHASDLSATNLYATYILTHAMSHATVEVAHLDPDFSQSGVPKVKSYTGKYMGQDNSVCFQTHSGYILNPLGCQS